MRYFTTWRIGDKFVSDKFPDRVPFKILSTGWYLGSLDTDAVLAVSGKVNVSKKGTCPNKRLE